MADQPSIRLNKVLRELNISLDRAVEYLNLTDDIEFSDYLLEKARVAVVPGTAFGAKGHIRLSFATSMELLQEAVSRIKEVLK